MGHTWEYVYEKVENQRMEKMGQANSNQKKVNIRQNRFFKTKNIVREKEDHKIVQNVQFTRKIKQF